MIRNGFGVGAVTWLAQMDSPGAVNSTQLHILTTAQLQFSVLHLALLSLSEAPNMRLTPNMRHEVQNAGANGLEDRSRKDRSGGGQF